VEILNLGGASDNNSSAPKTGKRLRVLLGIGALAAVTGIGSTLAANISLNGGDDVEFGQGVVQTTSCDPDDGITVAPVSTFDSTADGGDGGFNLTAINLTDIAAACGTKTFTLKGYGETGDAILFTEIRDDPTTPSIVVTLATPVAADTIYKITLESTED
jgi:hypothetical protein